MNPSDPAPDPKDQALVITGGCGFIGLNLVYHMAMKGRYSRYVILDNLSAGRLEDLEAVLKELGAWQQEQVEDSDGPGLGVGTMAQGVNQGVGQGNTRYRHKNQGHDNGRHKHIDEDPRPHRHPGMHSRKYILEHTGQAIEFYRYDIRHPQGLAEILAGSSAVVHLAAQTGVIPSLENPVHDMEQNVAGTLNLLEACRVAGIPRFVFASSSAPLGEQDPPIDESKVPRPLSPYGASKLAGEGYCSAYAGSFGLETVALRFSNVYGPRSTYKGSVVALFVRNILSGTPLTIYGSGGQTRDFIYVEDLCDAIDLALSAADPAAFGSVFQIATFRETTVNELAERLKAIAEKAGLGPVRILYEAERAGEIRRSFSDISRARELLGYRPAYDLDTGLTKTWEWFLARRERGACRAPSASS